MAKNFVAELAWRGMIHDIMPDTEKVLNEKPASGYIGFDPTSDSLHIGSLVHDESLGDLIFDLGSISVAIEKGGEIIPKITSGCKSCSEIARTYQCCS